MTRRYPARPKSHQPNCGSRFPLKDDPNGSAGRRGADPGTVAWRPRLIFKQGRTMKSSLKALPLLVTCALAASGIATAPAYSTASALSFAVLHTTAKLTVADGGDLGRPGPSAGDITTCGGRLVGADLKSR